MQILKKKKWYENSINLALSYILFFVINSYCIDGNPKYWSDYYGSLDNKREGYNNPTMDKFCDGLKACLNQVVFNAVWCLFDIGILYSYFKYGQKYFPDY